MVVRLSLESEAKKAIAVQQLASCVDAGLWVDGYLWVYDNTSSSDIDRALGIAKVAGALGTLWLDVEDTKYRPRPDQIRSLADYTLSKGQRVGIYTAKWFWEIYLGNPVNCADLPLWVAAYNEIDAFDAFEPFGGWQQYEGKQYHGNTTIAGIRNIDLNVFRV